MAEQQYLDLKHLDKQLDEFEKKKKKIKKMRIGYKLFAHLMGDEKFAHHVSESALNPDKRSYRKVKIKITSDEGELTFLEKDWSNFDFISRLVFIMYTSLYTFKFSPIYADRAFLCLNSMNDLYFFLSQN